MPRAAGEKGFHHCAYVIKLDPNVLRNTNVHVGSKDEKAATQRPRDELDAPDLDQAVLARVASRDVVYESWFS